VRSAPPGIVERLTQGPRESDALGELPEGQQTGVPGELARPRLDDERVAEEIHDLSLSGWYDQRVPPRLRRGPGASTAQTHRPGEGSRLRSTSGWEALVH
jgi:hypothetical protein